MDLTSAAIAESRVCVPPLDADLMDRYFSAFVDGGVLPAPARRHPRRQGGLDAPRARRHAVRQRAQHHQRADGLAIGRRLRALPRAGTRAAVRWCSRLPRMRTMSARSARRWRESAARDLDQAYRDFGDGLGGADGHAREIALYRLDDPVLRSHTPAVIATHADPETRTLGGAARRSPRRDAARLRRSARRMDARTRQRRGGRHRGDPRRVSRPRRRVARAAVDARQPERPQACRR